MTRILLPLALCAALFLPIQSFAQDAPPTSQPTAPVAQPAGLAIYGLWALDVPATIESTAGDTSPEERAMIEQMMAAMSMSITIAQEGTLTMTASMGGEAESEVGTWTLESNEGNTFVINAISPDGETEQITATTIDGTHMSIAASGDTMYFVRPTE